MTPNPFARPFVLALLLALFGSACVQRRRATPPPPALPEPTRTEAAFRAEQPDPAAWSAIGRSVQGRAIEACTLATAGSPGWRVYLIGGIHGDERPGGENVERLVSWWAARGFAGVTLRVVRDMNPDGTATGARTNSRGVDLNRNWPAANFRPSGGRGSAPLSEPESRAVFADLEAFDPDLVLVFHAARSGPFVNFDGPAQQEADRFALAAAAVDPRWHVVADMGYPTPGSLGTLIGKDRNVPILTVEFPRDGAPDEAWPALQRGLTALFATRG